MAVGGVDGVEGEGRLRPVAVARFLIEGLRRQASKTGCAQLCLFGEVAFTF